MCKTYIVNVDGKEYNVKDGSRVKDFISDNENIMAVKVDYKLHSLYYKIERPCNIETITYYHPEGYKIYSRSIVLLFIAAMRKTYPNIIYRIGNKLGEDYFISTSCDITDDMISVILESMKVLVYNGFDITKERVTYYKLTQIYESIGNTEALNNMKMLTDTMFSIYLMDGEYYPWLYGRVVDNTSKLISFGLEKYNNGENHGIILKLPESKNIFNFRRTSINKIQEEFMNLSVLPKRLGIDSVYDLNMRMLDQKEFNRIILMSENEQKERMYSLIGKILKTNDIRMILIAGPSSSGKTTFARKLQLMLEEKGKNSILLSMDDFFKNASISKDYDSISHLDIELFSEVTKSLLDGNEVSLPSYNFKNNGGTREYNGNVAKLSDGSIIIAEGIHALNPLVTDFIQRKNVFKIYVAPFVTLCLDQFTKVSSNYVRLTRRLVRDFMDRKVNVQDTFKLWGKVKEGELANIYPFVNEADAIFNTFLLYEIGILNVYSEPILLAELAKQNYNEFYSAIRENYMIGQSFLKVSTVNIPNDSIIREFIGGSIFA